MCGLLVEKWQCSILVGQSGKENSGEVTEPSLGFVMLYAVGDGGDVDGGVRVVMRFVAAVAAVM